MKKIDFGIKGAYGEKNFGDDALQYFLEQWANKNDLKPYFVGRKATYISKLFPNIKYIAKEKYHTYFFNTLLLGGGTQFFSFKQKTEKNNIIKLLISNPFSFFKKAISYFEKKFLFNSNNYNYLYAFGIGLGPFIKNSEQELSAKKQLTLMKGVYPRDKFSQNFSKKYNKNTVEATDICFLPNIINYKPLENKKEEIKVIGIIVRDWAYLNGGEKYLEKIFKELDNPIFNNYKIDFIFFKDEKNCEMKILEKGYNIIQWNPENQSIYTFLEVLSTYDLFISARFHGVIFGSLLNIPSIVIEIEPKLNVTKELLNEGVYIWKQPFDENLGSVIKNIPYLEMKEHLKNNVVIQSKKAEKMFDHLTNRLIDEK